MTDSEKLDLILNKVGGLEGRFDKLEERFDKLEERFDKLEERLDKLEERFDKLEERVCHLENDIRDLSWKMKSGQTFSVWQRGTLIYQEIFMKL